MEASGESSMKVGDLVKWIDGDLGIITKVHPEHSHVFYVLWLDDADQPTWHEDCELEAVA